MAANLGAVYLNGTNDIVITGNYVTFGGFQFTAGSIQGIVISVEGNHTVLTHLNLNGYSAQKYINLKGQYDQVTYLSLLNGIITPNQSNRLNLFVFFGKTL